jgi:hypothetical protein
MNIKIGSVAYDATNHRRRGRVTGITPARVTLVDSAGRLRFVRPENVRRGSPRPKGPTKAEHRRMAEYRWRALQAMKARGA